MHTVPNCLYTKAKRKLMGHIMSCVGSCTTTHLCEICSEAKLSDVGEKREQLKVGGSRARGSTHTPVGLNQWNLRDDTQNNTW